MPNSTLTINQAKELWDERDLDDTAHDLVDAIYKCFNNRNCGNCEFGQKDQSLATKYICRHVESPNVLVPKEYCCNLWKQKIA